MVSSSITMRKAEKEILRKLSDIFRKHYPYDELMWMSILRVELKKDFSLCTIYYEVPGDDDIRARVAHILHDVKNDLRRRLGKVLRLRRIPQLVFREVSPPMMDQGPEA